MHILPTHLRGASGRTVVSILFCALVTWSGTFAKAQSARVAVLFTPQKSYRNAASALEAALKAAGYNCLLVELPTGSKLSAAQQEALKKLADASPTLIAAAGGKATSAVLKTVPKVPVIFFMVPNALDASFAADENPDLGRLAGVPADVSPGDQISWIARLHPAGKKVGLLHSPRTKNTAEAFVKEAEKHPITIFPIQAHRDQFPKAIEKLNAEKCDSVLMIPDSRVYNSPNVQRLLLWGIRRKKPVWAFSASIIKAGALGGQYTTSDFVGRQAADLIQKVSNGADPAKMGFQYPRRIERAINERTAELIGLQLSGIALNGQTMRYGGKQ